MKKFLLSVILFVSVFSNSQNFTNGSVHDYDVGDTIVFEYKEYSMTSTSFTPPNVTYRVFTQKIYSVTMDSVTYHFIDRVLDRGTAPPYPTTLITSSGSILIKNLSTPIVFTTTSSNDTCYNVFDKSYINDCGFHVHEHKESFLCAWEANHEFTTHIEGVGFFYDSYHGNWYPVKGKSTSLVAVHKVNGKSCGQIGPFPTGLTELSANTFAVKYYPSPVGDELHLKVSAALASQRFKIKIKNVLGQMVYKSDEEFSFSEPVLDVKGLQRGVYFLEIWQKDELRSTRKIVKE
ncbi:MAG: T9SS type A sorting domain-containing protein [Bacteroidia bacterium]|nr:T9SS type A sorting domain-containing protein [Bacteroidia bacterium]